MSKYFIFIPNLLSIVRIGLIYPILNNILMSNFLISLGLKRLQARKKEMV